MRKPRHREGTCLPGELAVHQPLRDGPGRVLGLLRRHRFAVDPPYLPRAAFMTLSGALTSLIRAYENRKYGPKLADVGGQGALCSSSGTGVAARRTCTTCSPWTSGSHTPTCGRVLTRTPSSPPSGTRRSSSLPPRRRASSTAWTSVPMFPSRTSSPPAAPCARRSWPMPFPGDGATMTGTSPSGASPEEEVARWKESLMLFYKKLTWKFGRPLVLKSPPHTGRIAVATRDVPRRALRAHPPRPLRRLPVHQAGKSERMQRTLCLQTSNSPEPRRPDHPALQDHVRRLLRGEGSYPRWPVPRDPLRGPRKRPGRADERTLREPRHPRLRGRSGLRSKTTWAPTRATARTSTEELPSLAAQREISQAWRRSFDEWRLPERCERHGPWRPPPAALALDATKSTCGA